MIDWKTRKINFIFSFLFLFSTSLIFAQESKLGDKSDGNRSITAHLLNLYDEEGSMIRLDDKPIMPFSPKQTCIECHDYDKINSGLHFNYIDSTDAPGRPGEPWILVDAPTATQLPLSYRNWPGTYHPEAIGLSPWSFIQKFGRHLPGGGIGENEEADPLELTFRRMVSGKLEINCLSCHNKNSAQDQAEYTAQVVKQNFRWAATGACDFASVYGSARDMPDNYDIYFGVDPDEPRKIPPTVEYDATRFNSKGKVFFDITRDIPNERCYFCHSTKLLGENGSEKWQMDEDVHLVSGMACVDCHRNGINHQMNRGYEGEETEKSNESLTCRGCHLGDIKSKSPINGRLGAPIPLHKGLPPIHLERLTCTACHSGPWPTKNSQQVKTSRAHTLGTHTVNRSDEALPYLQMPIFAENENGQIEPRKLLWPSFWAEMEGDSLTPIHPDSVRSIILGIITSDTLTDSTNLAKIQMGSWPNLTDTLVIQVMDSLSNKNPVKKPVYVTGGKIYNLNNSRDLISEEHQTAKPVSWAFAHDVRPAAQSLGIRGCKDCHSLSAPFYFGKIAVFSPFEAEQNSYKSMTELNKLGEIYPRTFALSFLFRPWLKFVIILSCVVIALVLVLYSLKGLETIIKTVNEKQT